MVLHATYPLPGHEKRWNKDEKAHFKAWEPEQLEVQAGKESTRPQIISGDRNYQEGRNPIRQNHKVYSVL